MIKKTNYIKKITKKKKKIFIYSQIIVIMDFLDGGYFCPKIMIYIQYQFYSFINYIIILIKIRIITILLTKKELKKFNFRLYI